jgi:multiple sugar transport system ATP-binding protein
MKVSLRMENGRLIADEGTFRMELTPQQSETLRNYAGKDAIFGIRPEDLLYSETPDKMNNIPASVEVIEPLGSEIHLWVSTKKNQLVAKVPPRFSFHIGDIANLHPDLTKIHFFDLETEKAIF